MTSQGQFQTLLRIRGVWAAICLMAPLLSAVEIDVVPVANVDNAGELVGISDDGLGPDRVCGVVTYVYNIGKYEVTTAQYTEFLNAVAAQDTYGLYTTSMWSSPHGCKIQRSGSPGSYTYSVAAEQANRPVNFVSWADAARFANWLHNGQPSGAQEPSTTEDGVYQLRGATIDDELLNVYRKAEWNWAITSEDEWYKAAYHKNNGPTGDYFDYPTNSDIMPSNDLIVPDPGNNANFYRSGYTLDDPGNRTDYGSFANSASPYGTYDQGGNVAEWNESLIEASARGIRGGSFDHGQFNLHATNRGEYFPPTYQDHTIGFRVTQNAATACPTADATGDCMVDMEDFAALMAQWLTGAGAND